MSEMVPFGSICSMYGRNGDYFRTSDFVETNEGIIAISPENIQNNTILYDNLIFLSQDAFRKNKTGIIHKGDILLCRYSSVVSPYKAALVRELPTDVTVLANPSLIVISDIACVPDYLQFIITSQRFQSALNAISKGNLHAIGITNIAKIMIPIPSTEKQLIIASQMSAYRNRHEELISLLRREIDNRDKVYNEILDELLWEEK